MGLFSLELRFPGHQLVCLGSVSWGSWGLTADSVFIQGLSHNTSKTRSGCHCPQGTYTSAVLTFLPCTIWVPLIFFVFFFDVDDFIGLWLSSYADPFNILQHLTEDPHAASRSFPSAKRLDIPNQVPHMLLGQFHQGTYFLYSPSTASLTFKAPLVCAGFYVTLPGFLWDRLVLTYLFYQEGNQLLVVPRVCTGMRLCAPEVILEILIYF